LPTALDLVCEYLDDGTAAKLRRDHNQDGGHTASVGGAAVGAAAVGSGGAATDGGSSKKRPIETTTPRSVGDGYDDDDDDDEARSTGPAEDETAVSSAVSSAVAASTAGTTGTGSKWAARSDADEMAALAFGQPKVGNKSAKGADGSSAGGDRTRANKQLGKVSTKGMKSMASFFGKKK